MWYLWAKIEGEWRRFASFAESTGEYAKQVKEGVLRAKNSENEDRRNAAALMQAFVLTDTRYTCKEGKAVMRALRHFDEVGLSNDIHAALEEALGEGAQEFTLAQEGINLEK